MKKENVSMEAKAVAVSATPVGMFLERIGRIAVPKIENRRQVFFASFCHMFCDLNPGALPALLPYIREAGNLTYSMTTGLMFANAGFSSVFQPLFGIMADKRPSHWYMALGILIAGCGMAATAFFTSYWALFLAVMFSGLGTALFHPAGMRFIHKVSGKKKGASTSIFSVGGNAGYLFAPMVAVAIIYFFGLRGLFFLAPLAMFTAWIALKESKKLFQQEELAKSQAKAKVEDDRPNDWRSFGKLTVCVICRSTVMICLRAFIPLYWIAQFGRSPEAAALALTLFGACGVVGNIMGGRMADRYGELTVIRGNHLVMLLLLIVLPLVQNYFAAYVLLMACGFVFFMSFSPLVVLGQRYMSKSVGFAAGVTLGLGTTFGGVFAPALGYAADLWGLAVTFPMLAVGVLIGLATSFTLKKPMH